MFFLLNATAESNTHRLFLFNQVFIFIPKYKVQVGDIYQIYKITNTFFHYFIELNYHLFNVINIEITTIVNIGVKYLNSI